MDNPAISNSNGFSDLTGNDAIELRQTTSTNGVSATGKDETAMAVPKYDSSGKSKSVSYVDSTEKHSRKSDPIESMNRDKFDTPVLESRPPSYLWLAICTTIFFNPLLGLIAIVVALQADNEYIKGNSPKARWLGQIVKILCILSIVITFLLVTILAIFLNIDFTRI
ncbi:hypothetical protein FSP39_023175 [Pinctada imbricata]|uniref:Uncharacterized protein n=1 Tax=Pinctada imbricata TaxID=66713 RepID=A0AA88XWY1_PINIB|nr:hypothetical protein FSP39_023175 [Pinctada imbricata]